MIFPLYIAKRYLFSKKSQNIINVISAISVSGVAIGTMALIAILSVFNGFDGLISSLFNSFDPDIKITAQTGKTFSTESPELENLKKNKNIAYYVEVIEENALFEYNDKQYIGIIKGVGHDFSKMNSIDTMLIDGKFKLRSGKDNFAVIGVAVAHYLSIGLNLITPVKIWVPKRNEKISYDVEKAFNKKSITPIGIFSIQPEYDSQYIIVPIEFAKEILDYSNQITSIEIKLKTGANYDNVQNEIISTLGKKYQVKNRYQQHEMLYKIMKSEKWAIYLILTFILIIASFNVIGSLTMLIVDKKNDIEILKNLGADKRLIQKIFLYEGWFISIVGAIIGLLLGAFICILQQKFGFIELPDNSAFVKAYPVTMKLTDFIYVFLTVLIIGFIAAWYPVKYISKKSFI